MPAKSIIHKTLEHQNESTCLDIGSGFDSIFVGLTREGQFNSVVVSDYYKDLLFKWRVV